MTASADITASTAFAPVGLKTLFSGEHAWCGEKMMLTDELVDAVPLADFFGTDAFSRALDAYAAMHGGHDRRAVASMWSLYYFSALTIPYVVARRADHSLPVSIHDMTISLGEDGLPRAFGLPAHADWSTGMVESLPALVMPLISQHLSFVVAELKRQGGLAPKLAWNNAAVYIDYAFNATARAHKPSNVPEGDDRAEDQGAGWASRALFEHPRLPDGSANPFLGCLRHEMDDGQTVCRRKVCCLRYLLPGVASCGALCALPAQRKQ